MPWRDSIPISTVLDESVPLSPDFFGRDTAVVARELIGCVLVAGDCAGRIVETEAYLGEKDGASHAAPGPTPRNAVMFGPAGTIYVYLIYGMYHCLNFVTEQAGVAGAVLIRALEPLAGLETMRGRRSNAHRWEQLASGPGKLTLALGIGPAQNGLPIRGGPLDVRRPLNAPATAVAVSPRIGIRKCADWPMRFFETGNPCVSRSPLNKLARPLENV